MVYLKEIRVYTITYNASARGNGIAIMVAYRVLRRRFYSTEHPYHPPFL